MGSDKQDSVVLHFEDFEEIDEIRDAEAGKLLKAILSYVSTGELPDKLGVQTKTMFAYIRRHIDRDKAKYNDVVQKRSAAGKKGGRPKKREESKENQNKQMLFEESKKSYPDTVTDPDPDTVTDTVTDPDPVAQKTCAPDGDSGSGFDRAKRIRFLETMCKLYQSGALQCREDYEMWAAELKELRGG